MPYAPPMACVCGGRRRAGEPCPKCGHGGRREHQRQHDAQRGTRTQRGYDNRWLAFSKAYLDEHPLCVDCSERGLITAAEEVHHKLKLVDHPESKYDTDHLSALCKRCHSRRTARGE